MQQVLCSSHVPLSVHTNHIQTARKNQSMKHTGKLGKSPPPSCIDLDCMNEPANDSKNTLRGIYHCSQSRKSCQKFIWRLCHSAKGPKATPPSGQSKIFHVTCLVEKKNSSQRNLLAPYEIIAKKPTALSPFP